MKVDAEWRGQDLILRLRGALTMQNSNALVAQLQSHLKPQCRRCVLDAAALEQLDSSGVGAIVTCLNQARQGNWSLRVAGLTGRPLQAVQVAKADRFLALFPDVDAALAG